MTSENKAPECGHPFCGETCGSAAIEAPHTQRELTQIAEASASVFSRSNEQIDTLRDELAKEKAKVARLVEALKACVSSLERADTAEGVCCCGDNMESHGAPMNCGHSPVDMGDYYASKALEAAKAAAQADYTARIRAAIQTDPDARQADLAKAWMMAREDAVGAAKHAGLAFGYERAVQAIRALTPPADLAARIGGE